MGGGDGLAITLADVEAAAARIEGEATVTPVHTSRTMDGLSGRALFFKCELFQRGGAFKFRGALNAVRALPAGVNTVRPTVVLTELVRWSWDPDAGGAREDEGQHPAAPLRAAP